MEGLQELIERLESEAKDVSESPRPRQTQAYANGVAAGIRYAKDELEDELDESAEG